MLPQIILIILIALNLGMALTKHGEPRIEKYNFWAYLLSDAIVLGLLFWGGFFDVLSR